MIDRATWSLSRVLNRSLLAVGAIAVAFGILVGGPVQAAPAADTFQVRLVADPVDGTSPSFVSPSGDYLAWTGTVKGTSKMYYYDLVAGKNVYINPGTAGSYYNPAAEGTYIVFQGSTSGGYDDIYLYNRSTKKVKSISYLGLDGDRNDCNPRIQDARIVWEKDTADPVVGSGIYIYDIATSTAKELLTGDEYGTPDIHGNYLVCVKDVVPVSGPTTSQIILYDLTTAETKIIAGEAGGKVNEHPRIDGTKVVWSSGDPWTAETADTWTGTYQVSIYDIATEETTVITDDLAGNLNPSVGGDLVVWQTWTPSTVKGYRISTGTTFDVSGHGDTFRQPEVDGTRVAWWGAKGLYYAVPTAEATSFPDVPDGHHYLTAIEGITSKDIMTAYGSGDFGPRDWVIHQQFAFMLDVTAGYDVTENDIYDFTDEPGIVHLEDHLYPYHYVAAAALKGAVPVLADGTYRPLFQERGAEAVASAIVAGGTALATPPQSYVGTLTNDDPLVAESLRVAEYNGLLNGVVGSDGTLATWDPDSPATRAEIAQLLWNLYAKVNPTN